MIPDLSIEDRIPVKNISNAPKQYGSVVLQPGADWQMVPMSFVSAYGWDKSLRFDFSAFKDRMATRVDGKFTFDWWCPLSMIDGYGRHALAIYKGFQKIGVNPVLHDVDWVDKLYLTPDIEQARHMSMYKSPSKIGCAMTLPYDKHIHTHQSVHKIVVTQFETDKIPERHVANVNFCDHLIVTSKYQVKVWKKSGINIPISVMTPGIDTDYFQYTERVPDGRFKLLLLGAITHRKNPALAIKAFKIASEGRQDWRLTIKTRKTDAIQSIERMAAGDPRIEVLVGDSHPDSVRKLYYDHDGLIWPSKGEGVGLPPLEAMATGMELVCSDNSGMSDYVSDEICYPIKTSHMESASIPQQGFSREYIEAFGDVGNWWVPDEQHAISQLRKCFDNWLEGKGKGRRAAEYIRKNYNLARQSQSIVNVLAKYE